MSESEQIDFLVIGSGIAGLTFALDVADHGSVMLITKKKDTESNTNYAQGGIAAVLGLEDSFDQHVDDTLRGGAGLCNRKAVEIMAREGPERILDLQKWGVEFSYYYKDGTKVIALGREGGHSQDRIVHKADYTGREVEQTLVRRCQEHPNVQIFEHHAAIDLAVINRDNNPRCVGLYVLSEAGSIMTILARVIFLATGGTGRVYLHTTNPSIATGDGIAMAYRAGAKICNLEFLQFHPTALYPPDDQAFLISEAVRGFGGILRTSDGETFMKKYHPQLDLAPRDIVARAIDAEMKSRGEDFVYLDITGRRREEVRERFPSIYSYCLSRNINITDEWIPVVPAAHYMCGGVVTDLYGKTTLPGLYAAGEVAWSGVHGANRLASNSLLEAVVFSHRAADKAVSEAKASPKPDQQPLSHNPTGEFKDEEMVLISHDSFQIRKLMWDYVGIVRSTLRLERAKRRIDLIRREVDDLYKRARPAVALIELRNIALVAGLIVRSALRRKESRGLHHTTDYPETKDEKQARNTYLLKRNTV